MRAKILANFHICISVPLKQAKLATKDDIADFVENACFYEKLTNINKNVTFKACRG